MRRAAFIALALALVPAASARAAYIAPGASIVSASSALREQGDDASTQPDISADGRYVVFTTAARNLFPDDVVDPPGQFYAGGVFRRDLATGALALVALGDLRVEGAQEPLALGASAPSVSGDGRWVAFTTGMALVGADTNGATDVYVRDMTLPRDDPHAYELASAKDGGDVAASYVKPQPDRPLRDPGADLTPATAISDDGRFVAFSVRENASDLPDHAAADVPAGQVYLRDRQTKRTSLVTRVAGTDPPQPIDSGSALFPGALGHVVLSGDGSTVLWTGQLADQQVRFLPGESADPRGFYFLWRRVVDGPAAPTRRITGASDPDDPACTGTYTASIGATGPCYGPLAFPEQGFGTITAAPPAMSTDGRIIVFLAASPPRGISTGTIPDLWVTDMSNGVSRKTGTAELTREGTGRDPTDSAPITGLALSGDGRWAVIVTQRTRFLLPALALSGDVRAKAEIADAFLVDLNARTLQRAIHGFGGGDPDGAVDNQVTLSADGNRIAFAASASNLFFGDANQREDVFTVDRLDAPPPATGDEDPPADPPAEALPSPSPAPSGRLNVTVRRAASGKIRLRVRAPAKGAVTVKVRGKAPDRDGVQRGSAKLLGQRTVKVKKKGDVIVDVTLAKRYRSGLRKARSLDASAAVSFKPARGERLQRTISVRFKA